MLLYFEHVTYIWYLYKVVRVQGIFLATSLLGMDAPPSAYHCRQRTHCNSYAIRICDTSSNWTSSRCKRQCCPCGRRLHPRSSRSHSKASCMACCRLCSMAGTSCSTPMRRCRCICIKSLAEPVTSTEPWTKPHLEICRCFHLLTLCVKHIYISGNIYRIA